MENVMIILSIPYKPPFGGFMGWGEQDELLNVPLEYS
jgi:hypothetical protein